MDFSTDSQIHPLHQAARLGDIAAMKRLLAQGSDINVRMDDFSHLSPLVEAASAEVINRVLQELLDNDLQEVDNPQPYLEVAEILLASGADINGCTTNNWPFLNMAAFREDNRVVEWLLQHGADPQATDSEGQTALHQVAWHISGVLNKEAPVDATSTFRIIHHLLNAGLDVNTREHDGNAPLHVAVNPCSMGDCSSDGSNPLAAYILLQQGADPNVCNARGKTPLMMAVAGAWMGGGSLDCVRILLEAGADPQQRYAPNEAIAAFNAKTFQEPWKVAAEIPGRTAIDDALAIYDYWLDRSATEEVDSAKESAIATYLQAIAECLQLLQQAAQC